MAEIAPEIVSEARPVAAPEVLKKWVSKDRFASKRLRNIADGLEKDKRAVIEKKSAFGALLNVRAFRIPNELIDFIAANTSTALREYKKSKNSLVFSRDIVRKVFGVRCGGKPVVLLNKSAHSDLREVYKAGKKRADIRTAMNLLKSCAATDEATIIRTWDLLCLALVVAPKSSNHINLEYLASMDDPTKTEEYAWDEHLLELAMQCVTNIEKHKALPLKLPKNSTKYEFWITSPFVLLEIAYMDHLEFPPSKHIINKSVPRICYVKSSDFIFVINNDRDRKILNNTTIFGRRDFLPLSKTPYALADDANVNVTNGNEHLAAEENEVNPSASLNEWLVFLSSQELEVPSRFKHLHEKHKAIFASDVDSTMKSLAAGLKRMQSQRMSAIFVDVEKALKEEAGPSVNFQTNTSKDDEDNIDNDDDKATDSDEEDDEVEDEVNEIQREWEQSGASVDANFVVETGVPDSAAGVDVAMVAETAVTDAAQASAPSVMATSGDGAEKELPRSPRKYISDEAWNRAPDAPSFNFFEPGTEEYEIFKLSQGIAQTYTTSADPKECLVGGDSKESVDVRASKVPEPLCIVHEPVTPADPKETDVVNPKGKGIDDSSGFVTHQKKTRFKRAAKEDLTPPKLKKIKVSQDVADIYNTFVQNGRKLKRQGKDRTAKRFVGIGRYFTTYKAFQESFLPRRYLNSEVMNVWIEKFNHESQIVAKSSPRNKKKYAFTQHIVDKLIGDPAIFKPQECMDELNEQNAKFKILKTDFLYFPIVRRSHWVVPCVNFMTRKFHIFDSMKGSKDAGILDDLARNLFMNFSVLIKVSKLAPNLDFDVFLLETPEHPQQTTLYDCGFFSILYMDSFSGKVMAHFDNNAIPDLRKELAASLIEARDNKDNVEKIMEAELQKK